MRSGRFETVKISTDTSGTIYTNGKTSIEHDQDDLPPSRMFPPTDRLSIRL